MCSTGKHTSSHLSPVTIKPRTELMRKITEWTFSLRVLSFDGSFEKFKKVRMTQVWWNGSLAFPCPNTSFPMIPNTWPQKKRLAAKRLFYPNSCAIKCIFQLTKFADLSRLDTLIIYNVKVFFLYLKTKVTAFNFL